MPYNNYTFLTNILISMVLATVLSSCGGSQTLRETFKKQTPYEKYAHALHQTGLDETALGQDWIAAGQKALQDSLHISLPFQETGYFAAEKPIALSYRLTAKRGQQIIVEVEVQAKDTPIVFVDLFESGAPKPKHLAHADTIDYTLEHNVKEDGSYIIRVQPELLRSGRYTLNIRSQPTLAFPVQGKDSRNIASFWGNPRDGGRRSHEGIDIFAVRGTPALAAADGYVSRVNINRLGGKVVWLTDSKNNQTLYYAHLDSQLVSAGQRVKVGDTLGLIGNTGNAKTTAPHLHFGIYRFGEGAVDPLPYVQRASGDPKPVTANLDYLGNLGRVATKKAVLRSSPTVKSSAVTELPQHTPLMITSATENWYRIELPDGLMGYIAASLVEPILKPLRQYRLADDAMLLDYPHVAAAPLDSVKNGSTLAVFAQYHHFLYVKSASGATGWLATGANDKL